MDTVHVALNFNFEGSDKVENFIKLSCMCSLLTDLDSIGRL